MYDLFFIVQGMYGKFAIIFPLSVPYRMSRAERKEPSVCRNGRTVAGPAGKRGRDPVSGRIEAVLKRADVGIAMGAAGSDAAIEAADVVLMDDNPLRIAEAVALSRRTMRIVMQNIVFAIGIKAAMLLLGAFGIADMWEAVFADVGVTVLAVLNSLRAMRSE